MSDQPASTPSTAAPQTILKLATAYQISQALYVAAKLGIADLLSAGPKSSDELARATETHAGSLHRLLRALAAFDLLEEIEPGRFALTALGSCLRTDAPNSMRPLVLMFVSENFQQTWAALLDCIKTGQTAFSHVFGLENSFAYYAQNPEFAAIFNDAMTSLSAMKDAAVIAAYDFSGVQTVVDVGGGHGRLLSAILKANRALRGVLFDLPQVVDGAPQLLAATGVAERCEAVGGDVFEAVPTGGDVYVLSSVIHDWDDERAVAILANCRRAMSDQAKLLLVERVLPERIEPAPLVQSHVLGDLNMLVRTGGRERTGEDYRRLFAAVGLRLVRVVPTQAAYSLVEAVPA